MYWRKSDTSNCVGKYVLNMRMSWYLLNSDLLHIYSRRVRKMNMYDSFIKFHKFEFEFYFIVHCYCTFFNFVAFHKRLLCCYIMMLYWQAWFWSNKTLTMCEEQKKWQLSNQAFHAMKDKMFQSIHFTH